MGLINDLIDRFRYGDSDYDDYEEDYEDEYVEETNTNSRRKIQEQEQVPVQTEKTRLFTRARAQEQGGNNGMKLVLIKPSSFDDVQAICDPLLAGKAVVMNLEGLHGDISRRIIDFVSGTSYSIKGNMQKISNYIIIVTPKSIELSGDFADMITNAYETSGFTLKF